MRAPYAFKILLNFYHLLLEHALGRLAFLESGLLPALSQLVSSELERDMTPPPPPPPHANLHISSQMKTRRSVSAHTVLSKCVAGLVKVIAN